MRWGATQGKAPLLPGWPTLGRTLHHLHMWAASSGKLLTGATCCALGMLLLALLLPPSCAASGPELPHLLLGASWRTWLLAVAPVCLSLHTWMELGHWEQGELSLDISTLQGLQGDLVPMPSSATRLWEPRRGRDGLGWHLN